MGELCEEEEAAKDDAGQGQNGSRAACQPLTRALDPAWAHRTHLSPLSMPAPLFPPSRAQVHAVHPLRPGDERRSDTGGRADICPAPRPHGETLLMGIMHQRPTTRVEVQSRSYAVIAMILHA